MDNTIENITLKKKTYDALMFKASFYDTYVAGKIEFADEKERKDVFELWTTDNAVVEIEKYYKNLLEEFKCKIRRKFTVKFWRWQIKISRKA